MILNIVLKTIPEYLVLCQFTVKAYLTRIVENLFIANNLTIATGYFPVAV